MPTPRFPARSTGARLAAGLVALGLAATVVVAVASGAQQHTAYYACGAGQTPSVTVGAKTPLSTSVGTGSALILRNGKVWKAGWSRPTASSGTQWTVGGQPFPLAPGQVWVLLIDRKTPAKIG